MKRFEKSKFRVEVKLTNQIKNCSKKVCYRLRESPCLSFSGGRIITWWHPNVMCVVSSVASCVVFVVALAVLVPELAAQLDALTGVDRTVTRSKGFNQDLGGNSIEKSLA